MTNRTSFRRRLLAVGIAAPLLATTALAFAQGTPPAAPAAGSAPAAPEGPARGAPRAADPVTVSDLADMDNISLTGRVAEVFGNAFVFEDDTGRALVETGPQGNRETLVAVGNTVTVEGSYRDGQVRAQGLIVDGGERIAIERPRPDRDGPGGPGRGGPGRAGPGGDRDDGPRGPHRGGAHDERGERSEGRGAWFGRGGIDEAAAEAALTSAGYTEIALQDVKRHHAEFTARDAAGATWTVKVDENNAVREREPYVAPLGEDEARTAIEALGYTFVGDYEAKGGHVEADATDASGRELRVEIAADGSLMKERFED